MGCSASVGATASVSPAKMAPASKAPGPLTMPEVAQLQTSWLAVQEQVCLAGVQMFLLLFQKHPLLLAVFRNFGTGLVSSDRLSAACPLTADNPDLRRHAATVMGLLDDVIGSLDAEPEQVSRRLMLTGRTHRLFLGFEAGHFWLMRDPFLQAVEASLTAEKYEAVRRLYEAAIDWILGELYSGFESF